MRNLKWLAATKADCETEQLNHPTQEVAIRIIGVQQPSDAAYEAAWTDWAESDDSGLWEAATADGVA